MLFFQLNCHDFHLNNKDKDTITAQERRQLLAHIRKNIKKSRKNKLSRNQKITTDKIFCITLRQKHTPLLCPHMLSKCHLNYRCCKALNLHKQKSAGNLL